jgi:hypothetical protein
VTVDSQQDPVFARLQVLSPGEDGCFPLYFQAEHNEPVLGAFDPASVQGWTQFLRKYADDVGHVENDLVRFGRDLFSTTLGKDPLWGHWKALRAFSSGRPIHLTVEFGEKTHPVAELPLELLHETGAHDGFLFNKPGAVLVRTLLGASPQVCGLVKHPQVLFAWACPTGTKRFLVDEHVARLKQVVPNVHVLPDATHDTLKQHLAGKSFHSLVLLAHGWRKTDSTGIHLGDGVRESLAAENLATLVRESGLQIVFLCSCQTGQTATDQEAGLFSGVAQRLLTEVPCVVAMQANLAISRSAKLITRFLERLGNGQLPPEAVAALRIADHKEDHFWSVPVVYVRPQPWKPAPARKGPLKIKLPDGMGDSRGPSTPTHMFKGREDDLRRLNEAWDDPRTNVITFHAWTGAGKTTLVRHWIAEMARADFRGAVKVYPYSFEGAAGDAFIDKALEFFWEPADPDGQETSSWLPEKKGEELARRVSRQRNLLWLDGFQSVQMQEGDVGRINSPALRELVCRLAATNSSGLCVIGTQLPVLDLAGWEQTAPSYPLDRLHCEAGADLLEAFGLIGSREELKQAVEEVHGHALSLSLLGSYLAEVCGGKVQRREMFSFLGEDPDDPSGEAQRNQARRIMQAHENVLAEKNKTALAILRLVSLFTRPARPAALEGLLAHPPIKGLTDNLPGVVPGERRWGRAVAYLRKLKLLEEAPLNDAPEEDREVLSAHPLVREHFADGLAKIDRPAFLAGHTRLSEFFRNSVKEQREDEPSSSDRMGPLYQAAVHGCLAERYDDVFENIYWPRIKRREASYNTKTLHAYPADLKVLEKFFKHCWDTLHEPIAPAAQAQLLYAVAFDLRALGRLRESLQPMCRCRDAFVALREWGEAAKVAGDLSLLDITLCRLGDAVESAREAVQYADRSECPFERVRARSNLTNALIQRGYLEQARTVYQEAERIVEEDATRPELPSGKSRPTLKSYWFYELHLDLKEYTKARELVGLPKPIRSMTGMEKLDEAFQNLVLGRACLEEALATGSAGPLLEEGRRYLELAFAAMCEAKTEHHLPRVLLVRAALFRICREFDLAEQDLTRAETLARQKGMELFLTDVQLQRTLLHVERGNRQQALNTFSQARARVAAMEYGRRSPDVKNLAALLS